jgi:hypothetical protein
MKNAVATFQTISAIVVAIAAFVSPSMLMKTTLAMTLTAELRISRRSGCGAFGHRQDGQRDRLIREMSIAAPLWGATRVHGVAKGIALVRSNQPSTFSLLAHGQCRESGSIVD